MEFVGAVSSGIINGKGNLDLDYKEDSLAQVDANFICGNGKISEKSELQEKNIFLVKSSIMIFLNLTRQLELKKF